MLATNDRPPGPKPLGKNPWTVYKFFREFSRDPVSFVGQRFERFGDMYYTVSGGADLYVTRHPDHMHQVLVERAGSFRKRSEDLEAFLGEGLLNSNGETWRRHRRLIQPAFSRARLEGYGEIFVEHTQRRLDSWSHNQVIDVGREMMSLTLGIVCKTLFDHDVDDIEDIATSIDLLQEGVVDSLPAWVPTPKHLRMRTASQRLEAKMNSLIGQRRAADDPGPDLLSALVAAADERGGLSERQVRDELVTLFVAGHETTSLALTWTWILLSEHPEAWEKLQKEIREVVGRDAPRFEHLDELVYTGQVLDEAMRLYPPAYAIARTATEPVEIGDFVLPKGAEIIMWLYHMHRDERWHDDPTRFEPERFSPGKELPHPSAYIPFGAGQRTCIGRHFATFEMKLILASIAQRVRMTRTEHDEIGLKPRVTLAPRRSIPMRLETLRTDG